MVHSCLYCGSVNRLKASHALFEMEFVLSVSLQEVFGTHEENSQTVSHSWMELERSDIMSPLFLGTLRRSPWGPCCVNWGLFVFVKIASPGSADLTVQLNVSAVCLCSYAKRSSTWDRPTLMCSLYFIMTYCLSFAAMVFPYWTKTRPTDRLMTDLLRSAESPRASSCSRLTSLCPVVSFPPSVCLSVFLEGLGGASSQV